MSDAAQSPPNENNNAPAPAAEEQQLPGPGAFLKGVVGVLSCLDGYMNIALEQTEEYVNGQKTNEYGDAFVRGNNVLYISRLS
ncbi:U4/U6-U5 snRNP complex subunit lsm6 [Rhodotorula mucilaginosa]|uniref:U4/U6-U5 snRNP complex subunit lsm6 n=1 Tax=Rhodotorula mucilaginosa TaxID=5537 RepID=A0A9P6W1V9_RHOMI|nr:U4/U6-U5 snRNP complex subunit lsm6 [Rhodotorula mucilaginosa]TKA50717.1 hypothetical protein B0A53_05995 [Rhodotorula sp. CCFEE 5036]